MTLTAVRPVAFRTMPERNIMDRTQVGELIDVAADTITIYLRADFRRLED